MGDDHHGRTDHGSAAGWLDHPKHQLAVDILYKRTRRYLEQLRDLAIAQGKGYPDVAFAHRYRGLGAAGHRCRRVADHAGQGQRIGLVRLGLHCDAGSRLAARVERVGDLGTHRQTPGDRFDPVSSAQFHRMYAVAEHGLSIVFRRGGSLSVMVANPDGIHRHLGRSGLGAVGDNGGDLLADRRQASASIRPTQAGDIQFRGIRHLQLPAKRLHHRL